MRTNRGWKRTKLGIAATLTVGLGIGCANSRNDVSYLSDPNVSYYRGHATEIDYPAVETPLSSEVVTSQPPVTVRDLEKTPIRDISLNEAVQTSLMNSQIIRTAGTFLSAGNGLYTNPERVASVYDPAIQESGVLFGGRGVEAALSAFDAQLQSSMIWGRDEQAQNNAFAVGVPGGQPFVQETGAFTSSLSKSFAHGGSISLNQNVNYRGTNSPSLFQSAYTGNLQLQYQLPLLAGAGAEFTRVAGPIGQSFGGISGVSQGVLIARINNDLSIGEFEANVRNMVKDVEDTYWQLYLAYQRYDVAIETRERTNDLYVLLEKKFKAGDLAPAEKHQAEEQVHSTTATALDAQSQVFALETQLRRLMGLPAGDGSILRPVSTPIEFEYLPDWYTALTEALSNRTEIRMQKWRIKSLELQLRAAESLVRPRLDFVGGYQVNGFGDDLIGYNEPRLDNFYQTVTDADYTGWNLGMQMRWDIGFRSAKAQVRNYELRLAKAYKVLQEQEKEISYEMSSAFQTLANQYSNLSTIQDRVRAASDNVVTYEKIERVIDGPIDNPDLKLRAILRLGDAKSTYYSTVVAYNRALTDLLFRKGTLLQSHGIMLAEGGWEQYAYGDADYNHNARLHASPNNRIHHEPAAFAVDAPYGGVYLPDESPESGTVEPMPAEENMKEDDQKDSVEKPQGTVGLARPLAPDVVATPLPRATAPEPLMKPEYSPKVPAVESPKTSGLPRFGGAMVR